MGLTLVAKADSGEEMSLANALGVESGKAFAARVDYSADGVLDVSLILDKEKRVRKPAVTPGAIVAALRLAGKPIGIAELAIACGLHDNNIVSKSDLMRLRVAIKAADGVKLEGKTRAAKYSIA